MKYEKQIHKWLEAGNDQQTVKKLWNDYVVNGYSNKLNLTCAKKPIPFILFHPTDWTT